MSTLPSEDDLTREVSRLAAQLKIEIYGEKLVDSPAVKKLEELLSLADEWRLCCGFPVRSKSVKFPGDSFDFSASPSLEDLLKFWDATTEMDAQFFKDFAEAIEQRKKPDHVDQVRALHHILNQYIAWRRSKRGPITLQELKEHGVKNAGRVRTLLRLDFIKDDEAKRGKKREKNTE